LDFFIVTIAAVEAHAISETKSRSSQNRINFTQVNKMELLYCLISY